MELITRLKNDKKKRNAYTVTSAFVALYCWYTAFWDNINLENHVASFGMSFNDVLALFQLSCVAAALFGFFFIRSKYLSRPRSIWIAAHILGFCFMQLLMLSPTKELMITGALVGGLCVGFIAYRLFYCIFFFISNPNPVKAVAIAYIFIRIYIYTYAIAPVDRLHALFFIVQAATLLISFGLSLAFKENEIEIRRSLRENDFSIRDIWPALVFVAVFQICLSMYQGIIVPQMPKGFWLNSYQIIPSVITFFCLIYFNRFFTITNTVRMFIFSIAGGFIAYLALESKSRLLVDAFIQPAYLFADIFYIWVIYIIFFTYGSKYLKLRLFMCLNIAVHYLSLIAVKAGGYRLASHPKAIIFTLPFLFALFFLIPSIDTFVKKITAQREYIERQQTNKILLPPEHPSTLDMRDRFLETLYPDITLTQQEQEVLAYLIADQSEDVLAYLMGIRLDEAKSAVKSIVSKCGAATKTELIIRIGQQSAALATKNIEDIMAGYSLTKREKETCKLLLAGYSRKLIGAELKISYPTVGFHCTSIYKKLNINSLSELFAIFGYKPVEAENALQEKSSRSVTR